MAGEAGGNRWITVKAMKSLLGQLKDEDEIAPNSVQNFAIFHIREGGDASYVGYVDIFNETIELISDGDPQMPPEA
jgi:hypothetical protein